MVTTVKEQEFSTGTVLNLRSRVVPGVIPVTLESTDQQILDTIDQAGETIADLKPSNREWDWRECEGDKTELMRVYRYAYVHWYDISDDPKINARLNSMIRDGQLLGSLQTNLALHLKVPRPNESPYR